VSKVEKPQQYLYHK